jgi:type IV pilus assembly protein PilA
MRKHYGFSLIELLIVVAVILIIAAIAVPNLLRARRAANEASAATSVRTLTSAEVTYAATYPAVGYTCELTHLGPYVGSPTEDAAGLIDDVLAAGSKANYDFSLTNCVGTPAVSFFVSAVPEPGGVRKFCSDNTGVVRFDPGAGDCTAASSPLK